jgi:hypothetical protein
MPESWIEAVFSRSGRSLMRHGTGGGGGARRGLRRRQPPIVNDDLVLVRVRPGRISAARRRYAEGRRLGLVGVPPAAALVGGGAWPSVNLGPAAGGGA